MTTQKGVEAKFLRRRSRQATRAARETVANWKALSESEQLRVVREIVETRSRELINAYRGVMSVAWGYGTKCVCRRKVSKNPATSRPSTKFVEVRRRRDKVCVTFIIRKKISREEFRKFEEDGRRPDWAVPEQLLHFVGVGEQRRLCAVPTDVEAASSHRFRGHDTRITVRNSPSASQVTVGAATCVVRRPGDGLNLYLLSCWHVLGMMDQGRTTFTIGADVSCCSSATPYTAQSPSLATTADFYGLMASGPPGDGRSFDAALANVNGNRPALRELVPRMVALPDNSNPYEPFSEDILALEKTIVHAPTGKKFVDPNRVLPAGDFPMRYNGVAGRFYMSVPLISYLPLGELTANGDSGSPVTNFAEDRLLGMHIGGGTDEVGRPFGVMIPAVELLNPANYVGLGGDEFLRIVVNF